MHGIVWLQDASEVLIDSAVSLRCLEGVLDGESLRVPLPVASVGIGERLWDGGKRLVVCCQRGIQPKAPAPWSLDLGGNDESFWFLSGMLWKM